MQRWLAPWAWLGGDEFTADVAIDVADGHVVAVTAATTTAATQEIHHLDGLVLPGFVTTHSHAFHRALRGHTHAGPGDFWTWRDHMYGLAARLDPDRYHRLATEVYGEMLRAGFTTVGEFHYVHHRPDGTPYPDPVAMERAVVAAAHDAGIRLTLIDACYLASDVAGSPPTPPQVRFSDGSAEGWAARVEKLGAAIDSPQTRVGVAAHSVRAVSPADLQTVAAVANDLNAPLHLHVSEQRAENAACVAEHGTTPIGLLERLGALGPRTTAVHATHLTAADRAALAATGSGVCFCPTTERDLGDGIGPAAELHELGVAISLGTDSNAVIDPFEEMRAIEMNDRLRHERRGVHRPTDLLAMATRNGLAALGWGNHEPLAPGAPADFAVVDLDHPDLAGVDPSQGVAGLVHTASRATISDVVVGGRTVVTDRTATSGHTPASLHSMIRQFVNEELPA